MKNKDKEIVLDNKDTDHPENIILNEKKIQTNSLIKIFKSKFIKRRKISDKKLFLDFAEKYFSDYGYNMIKDSEKKNINIYSDNIKGAKYIFTAHYDTPTTSIIMNICNGLAPLLGNFSIIPITLIAIFIILVKSNLNDIFSSFFYILIIIMCLEYLLKRENKNNMNDNTSGLISLFILASTSFNKDIAFILFDNEEKGLKGSKQFSRESIELIDKDATIINLDCVASGTDWCIYSNEEVLQSKLLKILKGEKIRKGILTGSDHKPFIKKRDNQNHRNTIYISKKYKSKIGGYYHKNIHTNLDTNVCEDDIIELVNSLEKIII